MELHHPSHRSASQADLLILRRSLSRCLNHYTAKRNAALHRGATTYSNAEWASSAACESWLQSRLLDSELDAKAAEDLVVDLIERGRRPRISRAIAALLARDIAWAHLKGIAEISSYYLNENSEFEELLARPGNPSNCTAQDKALILFQARHFIKYHTASIREHIASMNAYREAADKGILLYFGSEIASYIGDAPYLKSLEK